MKVEIRQKHMKTERLLKMQLFIFILSMIIVIYISLLFILFFIFINVCFPNTFHSVLGFSLP